MLRTTLNIFGKSRHKIQLKRRKAQLKNRAVSNKRLKEEQQKINVSYEMKILNLRKEMDKVKSPNHHLNEIIEDLFYPQIRLNNQEEVQQRVKQMSSDTFTREEMWEQMVKMDSLTSELIQNTLPLELLEVHQAKGKQFALQHYELLVERLSYYCFKRQTIKQRRMENWEKLMKRIKSKDPKAKEQRCPYLFLEADEIPRHHYWLDFIEGMQVKISTENELQEVNKYIPILLKISKTFNHIPAELYQTIMNKNTKAIIDDIRGEGVSNLLKLFKYRNKLKFNPNIKIQVSEEEIAKEHNHLSLARKLTAEVIQHPENYNAQDLMNIFWFIRARKMRVNIIYQNQYKKLEEIFSSILGDLSFESVHTFFVVYCSMNYNPNRQFAQIIKYDLFRKVEECRRYFSLLDLINRIKGRKLIFKVYQGKGNEPLQIQFDGADLLVRLANALTQAISQLKPIELIQLVDCYYDNDIRQQSLLQILSTEIIRKGKQYDLQTLSRSLFKLTILGHKSKIAAKYVLQQFSQHYFDQMKNHKEKGVFLLPTEQPVQQTKMNFSQIYLQQCLLMMLWTVVKQLGNRLEKDVDLTKMFELFPTKIESGDPLALQLASNINQDVKELIYFPKIKCPIFGADDFPMGRLNEFYGKDFSKDKLDSLMEEEARESNLFVSNFNPKSGLFLKERWSRVKVYDKKKYFQFCSSHAENTNPKKGNCFFDNQVVLSPQFLQKRSQIIDQLKSTSNPQKQSYTTQTPITPTIYDLL